MKKTGIIALIILAAFVFIPAFAFAAERSDYKTGDKVLVNWKGKLYVANVIKEISNEIYRVHYVDWDTSYDENVALENIKPFVQGRSWKIGEKVMVLYDKTWYKAVIIDVKESGFRVHYEGWDAGYDEVVVGDSIKPRS
jgi:hypothetical protein